MFSILLINHSYHSIPVFVSLIMTLWQPNGRLLSTVKEFYKILERAQRQSCYHARGIPRSRDSSRKRKATGRRIPWKRRVLVLSLRRRILQVRYRTAISTMIARSTVIYEHFPRAKFSPLPTFPDYRLSAAQGRE